jgi:hypothetical protein
MYSRDNITSTFLQFRRIGAIPPACLFLSGTSEDNSVSN